jgi:hypothetical protein
MSGGSSNLLPQRFGVDLASGCLRRREFSRLPE